jgi:hypothetical protein
MVQASNMTVPVNNVFNSFNQPSNNVTSVTITQATDYIFQPPTAPIVWQQQQHHHRFSAGDIDDKFRAINPLPATRSLKFQPFTS